MIERKFVAEKVKEFKIEETIANAVKGAGYSHTKLQRTPLGEKIIIYAARPGLIVGRKGQNITKLTKELKDKFNLENPQIEISELENPNLDPQIVAESIAESLEKYGTTRFKGIMHKAMEDVMSAGALGVEIIVSGKIPGARAKSWRVYSGYLKKCGEIAISQVRKAQATAILKSGVVGIKVNIMPPDVKLPDHIKIYEEETESVAKESEKIQDKSEKGDINKETKKEERVRKRSIKSEQIKNKGSERGKGTKTRHLKKQRKTMPDKLNKKNQKNKEDSESQKSKSEKENSNNKKDNVGANPSS